MSRRRHAIVAFRDPTPALKMTNLERAISRAAYAVMAILAAVSVCFVALAAWDCLVEGLLGMLDEQVRACCNMHWWIFLRGLGYSVIDLRNALIAATPAAGLYFLSRIATPPATPP